MFKKLSVIALLALVIIPAGVFAAGTQAQGTGSGTMAAGGHQSQQQSDDSQVQGQYSYCNQIGFETSADMGNGIMTRDRICEQIQLQTMTQNQLQTMTQDQLQTMTQNQLRIMTQDKLQTMTQVKLQTMTQDKLQTMTKIQSRLKDGSCGNCPKLATTTG